ncbi:MAG: M1 family metallopeptidase, partial [Caldilineaceae bacterium]|nr:M1 family metallopeptidase [Caldilineaceae bacterium]
PIQAPDPTVGAPGMGDPLFPLEGNGGIDVQHYLLDIAWDASTQAIAAEATLTISPTQTLSAFDLDFHGLSIDDVTVDGTAASFARSDDELTITLLENVEVGEEFVVTIAYNGTPDEVVGSVGSGWQATDDGAFVLAEPIGAKNWFPSNNHPADKASYTLQVTVPTGYQVAANGVLSDSSINGEVNGGTQTYTFAADAPIATYLVTVAIGRFDVEESTSSGGIPIVNYLFADGTAENRAPFAHQGEMLDFFSTRFGPYPFNVAGAIQIGQGLGVALETQTRPIYGAETSVNTVAHELAHQWFGNDVSLATWDLTWLKESFATYGEWLWQEESEGRDALDFRVVTVYESLMGVQYVAKAQLPMLIEALELPDTLLSQETVAELLAFPTGRIEADMPLLAPLN